MLERPTLDILNHMHQNHCCLSAAQCITSDNDPNLWDPGMLEAGLVCLATSGDTTLSDAVTPEQAFPCPFVLHTFAWQWAMFSLLIRNKQFLPFVFDRITSGAIAHHFPDGTWPKGKWIFCSNHSFGFWPATSSILTNLLIHLILKLCGLWFYPLLTL